MKKTLIVACIACSGLIGLTGCETQQAKTDAGASKATASAPTTGQAGYEAALAAAKAEIKKADGMGGEWRDTGKLLKKADKAAAKGDFAAAIKLANSAAFQAKMGQEQAKAEAGVGNSGYLY